jgi:hypothetical protein
MPKNGSAFIKSALLRRRKKPVKGTKKEEGGPVAEGHDDHDHDHDHDHTAEEKLPQPLLEKQSTQTSQPAQSKPKAVGPIRTEPEYLSHIPEGLFGEDVEYQAAAPKFGAIFSETESAPAPAPTPIPDPDPVSSHSPPPHVIDNDTVYDVVHSAEMAPVTNLVSPKNGANEETGESSTGQAVPAPRIRHIPDPDEMMDEIVYPDVDSAPAPWKRPEPQPTLDTAGDEGNTPDSGPETDSGVILDPNAFEKEFAPPTREELLERLRRKTVRHTQAPRKKNMKKPDMKALEDEFFNKCGGDVKVFCKSMGIKEEAIPAVMKAAGEVAQKQGRAAALASAESVAKSQRRPK